MLDTGESPDLTQKKLQAKHVLVVLVAEVGTSLPDLRRMAGTAGKA